MGEDNKKGHFWWYFWIGLGVLIILGPLLPDLFPKTAARLLDMSGKPVEFHLVHLDGLDGLIVIEEVDHEAEAFSVDVRKISIFDLKDGRRVNVAVVDPDTACWGVLDDLLWCYSGALGLHGRAPATGEAVWSREDFLIAHPSFAGKLRSRKDDHRYDPARHAIHIRTNEGYWFSFNTTDRSLHRCPADPPGSNQSRSTITSHVAGDPTIVLVGSDRKRLRSGEMESADSYLQAHFLVDAVDGAPIRFHDPEGLAMVHFERMDESSKGTDLLLSRISPDGREQWRVSAEDLFGPPDDPKEGRTIELAHLSKHGLLLVFSYRTAGKMIMVQPTDGQYRWTHAL